MIFKKTITRKNNFSEMPLDVKKKAQQLHCFYDRTQSLSDDLLRFLSLCFVLAKKLKPYSEISAESTRWWKNKQKERAAEKGDSCD